MDPSIHPGPHSVRPEQPHGLLWPWQISLRDWRRVIPLIVGEISDDRLSLVSAALAFYAMLALFPGLIALVSLFGLVADPSTVEHALADLTGILPPGARELLREQLHALVTTPSSSLSVGLLVSVLTALWSASSGVDSLIDAMNVAYNKAEKRHWIRRRLMSLLLTLGLIVFTVIAITLVAVFPTLLAFFDGRLDALQVINVVRWPTLAALVTIGLFCLYRYGPCRQRPRRMDATGAIFATLSFLLVSSLFSLYVTEIATYNKTYGAVGSVVVLLFWFYYSSFVILIGAELSAELEGEKLVKRSLRPPP